LEVQTMRMEEEQYYLVCPKCRKITNKGWSMLLQEVVEYHITGVLGIDLLDFEHEHDGGVSLIATRHHCGFESREHDAIDFVIEVKGSKITDWGVYWDKNIDELVAIAKENGLKIVGRGVEE